MTKQTSSEAFVETPVARGQNAVHGADGYSRVLGKQGVCIARNGPGITKYKEYEND